MSESLLGMELTEIREALGPGHPQFRAKQIYTALYRQRVADLVQVSTLPAALRQELGGARRVGLPEIAQRYQSVDGTRRYLLRLDDGLTVETVLMPEDERDTVCISSQVGCPVDCKFCMTALMGLERNVTAGEIVGQVLLVARDNGLLEERTRLNIVMMGQGEPLLNLANVVKATRLLTDPEGAGKHQRVDDEVLRRNAVLLGQQPHAALGHRQFALARESLRLQFVFVDRPHHQRRAEALRDGAQALELLLAILQVHRVDDGFPLAISERQLHRLWVGGR